MWSEHLPSSTKCTKLGLHDQNICSVAHSAEIFDSDQIVCHVARCIQSFDSVISRSDLERKVQFVLYGLEDTPNMPGCRSFT